ncbi:TetR family transcriptional regulator [Streptomyces capparidis]
MARSGTGDDTETAHGGTADGGRKGGGDTRRRIQRAALDLFVRQGYEKTSLREVADAVRITKPAIYYHFGSKEEILLSVFRELGRPVEELIAWGREQPRTLETKREVLRRYGEAVHAAAPLFRCLRDNDATLRDLEVGREYHRQTTGVCELLTDADAPPDAQLRCMGALLTLHFGTLVLDGCAAAPLRDRHRTLLRIAVELVETAHGARG